MGTMYAKKIALQAARAQARNESGIWAHMAYHQAEGDEAYDRALGMARLWDEVAQCLDCQVKHKPSQCGEGAKYVADALVVHKSEIAYKVDHG